MDDEKYTILTLILVRLSMKKAGTVILISDRADFKTSKVRDKAGCYITIKRSISPRR